MAGRSEEWVVQSMTDVLAHRGPDGQGVRCWEGPRTPAALGHRRLSILDPTPRGAQPMSTPDGRYTITYNGEIYNFPALRRGLENDGVTLRSHCDTEVLLELFARRGPKALDMLNGIFAFAVWDAEAGELFLARDRLGVKPLYYAETGRSLLFASEIKALLPALKAPRLRTDALVDFLTFLWVPDPDTMFEGVMVLPPGHYGRWCDGRLELACYWDISFAPEEGPEVVWADALRQEFLTATERQLISDVPVGAFLSGGLDSTAIVAGMTRIRDQISTYTIGFAREDLEHDIAGDDVVYARRAAKRHQVDYHERILSPHVVDLLPKLVWHLDEPIADPAAISSFLLCRAARGHLTVMLSGMGGDELFAGYPRHAAARICQALQPIPRPVRQAAAQGFGRLGMGPPGRLRGPRRNLMKLLRGVDLPPNEGYMAYLSYYRPAELQALLSSELRSELTHHDPFRKHRVLLDRVRGEHWLNQLLYLDLKMFLPCLNLTYTDKMAMAASIEVRVPILDDEVVNLAGRIPPQFKLRGLKGKHVFREAMAPLVSNEILRRPKTGFGAPHRSWLVGQLRPMVEDLLSEERIRTRGLFDPAAVQRLLRDNAAGREDNAFRIWALLTLELWQQSFVDATTA